MTTATPTAMMTPTTTTTTMTTTKLTDASVEQMKTPNTMNSSNNTPISRQHVCR